MKELENLLNKLIEKWWKPWGKESQKIIIRSSRIFVYNSEWYINPEGKHIRELVSLESQLWNFVCKKDIHNKGSNWIKDLKTQEGVLHAENRFAYYDYEYRLLESALISKKDLPKFLIDNIDIKN